MIRHGGRIPNVPGLRLVPVGEGDLRTATLFGDAVPAATLGQSAFVQQITRYHRPAPPPLVLANGVAGLDRSPLLHDSYRSYGWVVPLERGSVRSWSADALATRIEHARSVLQAQAFGFELSAPVDELRAAVDAATVSGRRLLLLGGEAVALLLAFAVLAAARLRPDVDASRRRLLSSGTRRWQVGLLVVAESAAMALCGALVGWLAGSAVAAVVAGRTGEPVASLLRHSVLSGRGIALALLLAAAATLVLAAALTVRPVAVRGLAVSPLDVAAIAAVVVVAVALARGAADTGDLLASNGTGIVLLLLPSLVGFAAAVGAARLLPAGLRLLERAVPRDALAFRLAALGLARRPGYAAVAVGFVVVSIGLALFAETYRSTLVRGQQDQAAYAIPADDVVREDLSQLVPVRSVVTPGVVRSLRPARARGARDPPGREHLRRDRRHGHRRAGLGRAGAAGDRRLARRFRLELACGAGGAARAEGLGGAARCAASGRREDARAADRGHRHRGRRGREHPAARRVVRDGRARPQRRYPPAAPGRSDPARGPRRHPRRLALRAAAEAGGARSRRRRACRGLRLARAAPRRWKGRDRLRRLDRDDGREESERRRASSVRAHAHERVRHLRASAPADGRRAAPGRRLAVEWPSSPARTGCSGSSWRAEPLVFRVAAVAKRFPGGAAPGTSDFVVDRPEGARDGAECRRRPARASPPSSGSTTEPARRAAVEARLRRAPVLGCSPSPRSRPSSSSLRSDPVARAALAMLEASALIAILLALLGLVLGRGLGAA